MVNLEDILITASQDPKQGALALAGNTFGIPDCALDLAKDLLSLLPTAALVGWLASLNQFIAGIHNKIITFLNKIFGSIGLKVVDTGHGWKIIIPDMASLKLDPLGMFSIFSQVMQTFDAITQAAGEIYAGVKGIESQIKELVSCYNQLLQAWGAIDKLPDKGGMFGSDTWESQLDRLFKDRQRGFDARDRVTEILDERAADPSLEPCFTQEAAVFLSATPELFNICPIVEPEIESPFRFTFGPPKSKTGQFLLTSDGLYYDSQIGGLDDVNVYLESKELKSNPHIGDMWKFEHDPNVGGRGQQVSMKHISEYVNTLFDPDIIDDGAKMDEYYVADNFMAQLEGERNREVYDLSTTLQAVIETDGADSAIATNTKQALYAELSRHNDKINRRMKQIEIAVKIPQLFDPENTFGASAIMGNIPVNDFSVLGKVNIGIALEKQQTLVFAASELEGIIKPIEPIFVISPDKTQIPSIDHLTLPTVGDGSIIYSPSSVDGSSQPHILSLNTRITDDGLLATYDFLGSDVVSPSSTEYFTTNTASLGKNNAKLVGQAPLDVFPSGVGIPYFSGVCDFRNSGTTPSNVGSFMRLPDTEDFRNLAYGSSGFTVETWIHMPKLSASDTGHDGWPATANTSSLHRLILSCDNTGGPASSLCVDAPNTDPSSIVSDFGGTFTRGMVMGFTRDRQIVSSLPQTNATGDNAEVAFFIAPTQSISASNAGFVRSDSCASGGGWHSMVVDPMKKAGGKPLSDVSSSFMLLTTSFDVLNDELRVYLDGNLLQKNSLAGVFGTDSRQPIRLPTFARTDSFFYGKSDTNWAVKAPALAQGPTLNEGPGYMFTPWLVGGGYTDGSYDYTGNNFLNKYGGKQTGLKGYLGSIKFYKKPLNNSEALKNYNAQQAFFKNITT